MTETTETPQVGTEGPLAQKTAPEQAAEQGAQPGTQTQETTTEPSVGELLLRVADRLDEIDKRIAGNSNTEDKTPEKVEVNLTSGGNMQPAGASNPAPLNWDDLKTMSEAEINSRWKEVREILNNPPSK